MFEDVFLPIVIVGILFVGLPWIILHYVTKWKQAPGGMTAEDERLLDDMHMLARRLEERLNTVERIVAADNPDFRAGLSGPASDFKPGLTDSTPEWKRSLANPEKDYLDRRS